VHIAYRFGDISNHRLDDRRTMHITGPTGGAVRKRRINTTVVHIIDHTLVEPGE